MVVGVLTCCALLHFDCDLKTTQMNVQCRIIWELMFYKFTLGHNTTEATKNICYVKIEGAINHSTVSRCFKKFCSGCQNLDHQTRSSRPKIMESKTMLQSTEANSASIPQIMDSKVMLQSIVANPASIPGKNPTSL